MIDRLKRHAIQVLRRAGHTLDEISALVAVGKRTVQRVVGEPMITDHETGPPGTQVTQVAHRRAGRPSKAEAYRERVASWLTDEPELLSVELLRRAQLAGYDGAKSALYELVRSVRPSTVRPIMRFEGLDPRQASGVRVGVGPRTVLRLRQTQAVGSGRTREQENHGAEKRDDEYRTRRLRERPHTASGVDWPSD